MKLAKITIGFATLALAVASAASKYTVNLADTTWVGDKQLKAGQYKVEIQGDQAVFESGKEKIQVPATVEKSDRKFPYTELDASNSRLREIHVGGTNTKIVIKSASEGQTRPAGTGE